MGSERAAALALRSAARVGDRTFKRLVDALGSAGAVLAASPGQLQGRLAAGPALQGSLDAARERIGAAAAELERVLALGFEVLVYGCPGYPPALAEIADPPAVLYTAGALQPADRRAVAVVGSRSASPHGRRFARRLARDLARRGVTVVSGLAQGIDAAAHAGALEGGGRTLAVLGSGPDRIYPPGNAELAAAIRRQGAWLSEFPLGAEPLAHHFPRRNRVVSGLSLGVVVVEASQRSGSLITADCALDQGREVFAVPGMPGSYAARGCHRLLRQGAKLVESVDDVLTELPPLESPAPCAQPADLGTQQSAVGAALWGALEAYPQHIDEIAGRAGWAAAEVSAALMTLVLEGRVQQWPGSRYSRIQEG